jgi:hypothetical protein
MYSNWLKCGGCPCGYWPSLGTWPPKVGAKYSGPLAGGAIGLWFDLRRRRKKIPMAARAMTAMPPTAPPAIAPVLLELELLWAGMAVAVSDELEENPEAPAAITVTWVVCWPLESVAC